MALESTELPSYQRLALLLLQQVKNNALHCLANAGLFCL